MVKKRLSYFEITDNELLYKLRRYSCNGINYDEFAEPDFSKYAIETVWIENIGCSRRRNFKQATERFLISKDREVVKYDNNR